MKFSMEVEFVTFFEMTNSQSPGRRLGNEGDEWGGEQPLHDGDVPAGGLIDQVQLVHAVEWKQFVTSLCPYGQARAVLVEVDEVNVEIWLLHHDFSNDQSGSLLDLITKSLYLRIIIFVCK